MALKNWFAVAAVFGVGLIGHNFLNWPREQTYIVILFGLVAVLFVAVGRLTEIVGKKNRDAYAKLVSQFGEDLADGEEIPHPKHEALRPPGRAEGQLLIFHDFANFANAMNEQLRWGKWRLQEYAGGDALNYKVLYNGVKVGTLDIRRPFRDEYTEAAPNISAQLEIYYVPLMPFWTIKSFLTDLAYCLCSETRETFQRKQAEIDAHLLAALWDATLLPPLNPGTNVPRFRMSFEGQPLAYLGRGQIADDNKRFWESINKKLTGNPSGGAPANG